MGQGTVRQAVDSNQDRKEKVLGKKKNAKLLWGAAIFLLVAGGSMLWFIKNNSQVGANNISSGPSIMDKVDYRNLTIAMLPIEAVTANGVVEIPLGIVKEKKLVYYEYKNNGKRLPMMSYITPEGKLITAVSMCEPCRSTKFHIEGDNMVCNTCGTRWDLESLRGISGGCLAYPPDVVAHTIQGDKVRINESEIANWQPRV
ncbi:MAG: DUF2318 domain-containing protein [Syntrophales bacterium LBB04]|nr:DUF2318 domain-containing protein [Syntrophales bacterium LBB04]